MARNPRPGAPRSSAAWRERVGAGVRRRLALEHRRDLVLPVDLRTARKSGTVRRELRELVGTAADELEALVEALGGEARVSPQRRALLADAARLGLLVRVLSLRFLQGEDAEDASRIGTLTTARRSLLQAAGLDEHREERSLSDYLAEREAHRAREAPQDAAGAAEGGEPEPEGTPAEECSAAAHEEPEARAHGTNGGPRAAEPEARLDGGGGEP